MSQEPQEAMDVDERVASDHGDDEEQVSRSEELSDGESEPPADLMVTTRARRTNAGNRMATLLATTAAEEEEWGEEWEEAANEEEFVGDDNNDQADFNLESSSSEDEDDGDDDDAGEKELQKAERQERIKKRKPAANPFAARLAATARKRVKLDVPSEDAQSALPPRPKKKSERASWIPTDEDGPIRTSSRRLTMANKEHTMAKLKAKDRRRDDTLAMMKAAEARKSKDEPKTMSQAERLAEAARVERVNSKSLHRWEEAEEQRAAERQAKIDALKNRQLDGPFIRFYSGPAIWVDDKLKYTGKNAPKIEDLTEKYNKEVPPTPDGQEVNESKLDAAQGPETEGPHPMSGVQEHPLTQSSPAAPASAAQLGEHAPTDHTTTTQAPLPTEPHSQPQPQPQSQAQSGPQPPQQNTAEIHVAPPQQTHAVASESISQPPLDGSETRSQLPTPSLSQPQSQSQPAQASQEPQQSGKTDSQSQATLSSQPSDNTQQTVPIKHDEQPVESPAVPNPGPTMSTPQDNSTSFLSGIEQYVSEQHDSHRPSEPSPALNTSPQQSGVQHDQHLQGPQQQPSLQNGLTQDSSQSGQATPSTPQVPQNPFTQLPMGTHTSLPANPFASHPPFALPDLPFLFVGSDTQPPGTHLQQPQPENPMLPPPPPPPPRRRVIRRALRNLLTLSSFPNLDSPSISHIPRSIRATTSLAKEKDRVALAQLSATLFNWSQSEVNAYLTTLLNAPKNKKEREALAAKSKKELCTVTNLEARFRDPETGIAYRDKKAYGILKGVVSGGFIWCGGLGCYVGGRPAPPPSTTTDGLEMANTKKFYGKGMEPVKGVPKRFLQMAGFPTEASPPKKASEPIQEGKKEGVSESAAKGGEVSTKPTATATATTAGSHRPAEAPGVVKVERTATT
ncbi:YL1-domain-containing protein [Aaosphaeria arxii CBS 175.79]|uniref:YL1-domain-containing protein n=1 Tax=Aaosphaeria arxii CBS 175.79 TaxID=1450172 RepID=A0A6A5X6N1_9PLEO|nr:YL1-domain-containing protein [Aaosphaeria arxii CBS 175.79]KAF2008570.1 YL1-domain-containing protein [Aaosphaeria arxii CBS 175.79]